MDRVIPYGIQIIRSDAALEESNERLFPLSKNRSRRIHKKLVKRHGGEFRKVPCIWRVGDRIIAHPVMYAKLMEQLALQADPVVREG